MSDLQKSIHKLSSSRARSRRNMLFKSCDPVCYLCDAKLNHETATLDHLIPRSIGGTHYLTNLALACSTCNRQKSANLDSEHIIYILNRLQQIPQSVEEFLQALIDQKMVTDVPTDFTHLCSHLIRFYRTVDLQSLTLRQVYRQNVLPHDVLNDVPNESTHISRSARRRNNLKLARDGFVEHFPYCSSCSTTVDLTAAKIINNRFGGGTKQTNLWCLCHTCASIESNRPLEKFRINYLIRRDFGTDTDSYPNTANQVFHYLKTNILKTNISAEEESRLIDLLQEVYDPANCLYD